MVVASVADVHGFAVVSPVLDHVIFGLFAGFFHCSGSRLISLVIETPAWQLIIDSSALLAFFFSHCALFISFTEDDMAHQQHKAVHIVWQLLFISLATLCLINN